MRGDNHLLAITTAIDEVTGEVQPLFAFPVQVCKATDSGSDARYDVAAPSGAARKQQFVDEATGEVVADEDCPRGVRVGDAFFTIAQDQREAIDESTKIKTMVALGRKPLADVDFTRATGLYFLQSPPKGGSHKAYRLTYEALREVRKGRKVVQPAQAIVTKRTAKTRQKLAVIYADEQRRCLAMVEMCFADAMRQPDEAVLAPQIAEVEEAQIEMARTVIAAMPDGDGPLQAEIDEALPKRRELMAAAADGKVVEAPKPVAETKASEDLTSLLAASVEQATKGKAKAAAA